MAYYEINYANSDCACSTETRLILFRWQKVFRINAMHYVYHVVECTYSWYLLHQMVVCCIIVSVVCPSVSLYFHKKEIIKRITSERDSYSSEKYYKVLLIFPFIFLFRFKLETVGLKLKTIMQIKWHTFKYYGDTFWKRYKKTTRALRNQILLSAFATKARQICIIFCLFAD